MPSGGPQSGGFKTRPYSAEIPTSRDKKSKHETLRRLTGVTGSEKLSLDKYTQS
jgi:hypothetical protein